MRNSFIFLTCCFFLAATFLLCTPSVAFEDCSDPKTQTDMNICSGKSFEQTDKELNEVYQKALGLIDEVGQKERFKAIQRAWMSYRDLNCKYASDGYEGGTIAPLIYAECMKRLTSERITEIPELFQEWE